ncbi:MAG: ABC transporter permease [Bdellovibrionota bacterium]
MKKFPISALPALIWFLVFLVAPLFIVLSFGFAKRGLHGGLLPEFTFENYLRVLDPIYLGIFAASLKLATITAFSCLVLGFPIAYWMAVAGPRAKALLIALVVLPFWTNFVVRAFAIRTFLADEGPVNHALSRLAIIDQPYPFANSSVSIWLGMVSSYLPFMILPLYVAIDKLDFTMLEAARDLGARSWQVFFRILIPLNRDGIVTGLLFVFTPALGEFVIPDLLGGARAILLGNLVTDQFLRARDWPFGSALSLLLMFCSMLALGAYLRMIQWDSKIAGRGQNA